MHGVNAGPLHCVIAPLFVTLAAVLLSVIVLLVVGLPCCVVPARGAQGGKPGVEHSLTLLVSPCLWLRLGVLPLFWIWGGMRGCSYLASYDELLYICVHTPSISPTPTVGGTLILADGFHLRLCILLSISNVILSHLNLRAGSADSPHLLWKRRSCGTTALPLLYFQQCHFTFSAFRLVGEA